MDILRELPESFSIEQVSTDDRIRKDYGDIDALARSIKELGLIQKIVLSWNKDATSPKLVVGERRLRALKRLGVASLEHKVHFLWSGEIDDYTALAIELEENIRRKALTWQEDVLAKQRLLETMQRIHGIARTGAPSRTDKIGLTNPGFGVNKLAALLGESNAQTSRDLELASLITAVPQLAKAETKETARKQAVLATAIALSQIQQAKKPIDTSVPLWTLYDGDFVTSCNNIEAESVDFVITDPPYGGDVQGMGANSRQLLAKSFVDDYVSTRLLLEDLARASWRVLRQDRFAVFFFGFVVYDDLIRSLTAQGFVVDTTPLIWVKNTVINTSPYTHYSYAYEPILIARKGQPKLMRPSQSNVIQANTVTSRGLTEQKFYHAQKPVSLIEKLILDMTPPGSTIVDFCAGSGTTGEAAIRNKRPVVLFEKDPTACTIIRTRLGAL